MKTEELCKLQQAFVIFKALLAELKSSDYYTNFFL